MSNRNFNTKEMKIAFFDIDEDDRDFFSLEDSSLKKLLNAIDYGVERSQKRSTDVRMSVVLSPDLNLNSEQLDEVMNHIGGKVGLALLATMEDTIILQLEEEKFIIAIKFIGGGSKFVKAKIMDEDDGSTGSACENLADFGLTQECTF